MSHVKTIDFMLEFIHMQQFLTNNLNRILLTILIISIVFASLVFMSYYMSKESDDKMPVGECEIDKCELYIEQ